MVWIHWLRRDIWDYGWSIGIPGNVLATPIIFGLGMVVDRLLFKPARKARRTAAALAAKHTAEVHRLLHHANPEMAIQLGQTPHGGWDDGG